MNPSFQGTMLREAAETLARAPQGKVQGKVDRFRRRKDLKRMVAGAGRHQDFYFSARRRL